MAHDGYETLRIAVDSGVARVTIDHPPINLFDLALMLDLARFGEEVASDDSVRVVVVDSADPDFFIAHADVTLILGLPRERRDVAAGELGFFHSMVDRFRTMPKATIAVIEGRVRGGGSEFVSSFDMRFASRERAVFGQPEVPLGIIPGGSGTQRLPRLVGRARALEIILGGADVDGALAEEWGWVNRAFPDAELRSFVDALARRIASFPAGAIAAAKRSVDNALNDPIAGLCEEERLFSQTLLDESAIRRMEQFMAAGGQKREIELDLPEIYSKLS
ncbi:MAG TPA: enoyl-CoA hydratase/isomerase family protein [Acidimicrobiales bacterium]|jgi:enoyl-CoA hydratase/carnithine racemase|nr:enoyl-CoA hydratase/isomerase family protein [Acidimicrobiales bacterium]